MFARAMVMLLLTGCSYQPPPPTPVAPEPEATPPARAGTPVAGDEPFAVVELFTSEGCSSCPPADRVLHRVDAQARAAGRRVYALSFHVDYWNDLGWSDPFSSPAYSERQRRYSSARGERGVYTPQMVVNGADGFTGSDEGRARRAIDDALAQKPSARLTLAASVTGGRIVVRYDTSAAPPGAVVHVALVERTRSSVVLRGENAGKTLEHDGVVRALATAELDGAPRGTRELDIPGKFATRAGEVVAFVQLPGTMQIVAAQRASIAP